MVKAFRKQELQFVCGFHLNKVLPHITVYLIYTSSPSQVYRMRAIIACNYPIKENVML